MDQSPLRSKRCRRRGTRSGRAQLRQEVVPQTISLQARLIRGLRRMEQIRAQVYLVCAEATVSTRTRASSLMLKDLTFIASLCRWSARVYSGSAGRTASNAMTLRTPGRGPLPGPIRCDAIAP